MGMTASQARFLMLTAQKNNNEYQAQRIASERLVLAASAEKHTVEYNDKMQNKTLLFNVGTGGPDTYNYNKKLTYDDIVRRADDADNPGLGARLTTVRGKVVVPELPDFNENGLSSDGLRKEDYFVDPEIKNADILQSGITNGVYFIERLKFNSSLEAEWTKVDYNNTPETLITETLDKTDDAEAQSKYDEVQEHFHRNDKKLELALKKLESEHKALETEMESVKKVIQEDVESSFKTFG